MNDAMKAVVNEMLADCEEAIRALERQRRSLRALAAQFGMGASGPEERRPDSFDVPIPHANDTVREIERMRSEIMAKVMADRDRIVKQAQEAAAAASQKMSSVSASGMGGMGGVPGMGGMGGMGGVPGMPGMPPIPGMPSVPPGAGLSDSPWGPSPPAEKPLESAEGKKDEPQ